MLKRLISLSTMLFILSVTALAQNEMTRQIVYLNTDIDRSYAGSTVLIGYPPVSDVWIMHNGTVSRSAYTLNPQYVPEGTYVLASHSSNYAIPYHVYYNPTGSFYYRVMPATADVNDPYYVYMNMHKYYEEAGTATVSSETSNSNVVFYRNYVRPSDREEYTHVNYLVSAPVVTSRSNIIVMPEGVNYYKAPDVKKQHPIRDFRTDYWQNKYYRDEFHNQASYYDTYGFYNYWNEAASEQEND